MMTALWILVGLQLVQTATIVVLFRVEMLRRRKKPPAVRILESNICSERGLGAWNLYGPNSRRLVSRFETALSALAYADAEFPGVPVRIRDSYHDPIDPQELRDGLRVEAS